MNSFEDGTSLWDSLTSPQTIIIYVVAVVLLMIGLAVIILVNEKRFSSFVNRIGDSAMKAEEEEVRRPRFDMLVRLDEELGSRPQKNFADDITLEAFCNAFRNFAAGELHLYYDFDIIREFIAGLAISHILILQGMSGTGKTSLAFAFGEFTKNPSTVIPVQPMWKDRSDLLGYYNEFTKRFNETPLLQKIYEANACPDMYMVILDEMNIARVEYYFAEFLSLLEIPDVDSRNLEIVSDRWDDDPAGIKNGCVRLAPNMWFLGTANNDDSTFAISDKVYDRAMVININSKAEPFLAPSGGAVPITAEKFDELVQGATKEFSVSEPVLEKLKLFDNYLAENFGITFGNRIMKQILTYIPVYVACGGEELDALDEILSSKILRKLETQNTTYRKATLEKLCDTVNEYFGMGKMPRCLDTIRRSVHN